MFSSKKLTKVIDPVSKRCSSIKYEYTKDNVYLTDHQRDFYEKNGYLIIPNLVDEELIDQCKQRFVDLCNKKVITKGVTAMKDVYLKKQGLKGEAAISRMQDIYFDNVLSQYVCYKPILDVVQSIIGPNITCLHSILINKPPNSQIDSSRHPLHQDLIYSPFEPANSFVTVWTAMETFNKENGCLVVVPKSHKMELQPHDYPPGVENTLFYGVLDENNYCTVDVEMKKGDSIFIHPLLLHGSGPNLSKGFRKALTCHYADSNCDMIKRDDQVLNKMRQEEIKIFKSWGYGPGSFEMVWKKRCVLVRGLPGKLQKVENKL